jgi:hypothetical protein
LHVDFLHERATYRLEDLRIRSAETEVRDLNTVIGMGGFGEVRKGLYAGHEVAIKSLKSLEIGQKAIEAIENELLLMNNYLSNPRPHPNILLTYGYWVNIKARKLRITSGKRIKL